MSMKFCPECNANVKVVFRNGKRCCECCGFDADYMMPPVAGQHRISGLSTQERMVVKPDHHDPQDRTFSQYAVRQADPAASVRAITLLLIAGSVVAALAAIFIIPMDWALDEDMNTWESGTIFDKAVEQHVVYMVGLACTMIVLFMIFIPQYLGVVYFAIGFLSLTLNEFGGGGSAMSVGIVAFVISLVIGYYVYRYKKETGEGCRFFMSLWSLRR